MDHVGLMSTLQNRLLLICLGFTRTESSRRLYNLAPGIMKYDLPELNNMLYSNKTLLEHLKSKQILWAPMKVLSRAYQDIPKTDM